MLTHAQHASPTAVICENLQYFGGGPNRGEPDPRAVWDEFEALQGLKTILDAFVDEIAPDGTQLADERESLLWGFVNTLHMQTVRLDRTVDRLAPELKNLQASQDGSEINAWELERITERAQHLGDRRDAFERLRDAAAERYRCDTGNTWRPRHGSHTSRTSKLWKTLFADNPLRSDLDRARDVPHQWAEKIRNGLVWTLPASPQFDLLARLGQQT